MPRFRALIETPTGGQAHRASEDGMMITLSARTVGVTVVAAVERRGTEDVAVFELWATYGKLPTDPVYLGTVTRETDGPPQFTVEP